MYTNYCRHILGAVRIYTRRSHLLDISFRSSLSLSLSRAHTDVCSSYDLDITRTWQDVKHCFHHLQHILSAFHQDQFSSMLPGLYSELKFGNGCHFDYLIPAHGWHVTQQMDLLLQGLLQGVLTEHEYIASPSSTEVGPGNGFFSCGVFSGLFAKSMSLKRAGDALSTAYEERYLVVGELDERPFVNTAETAAVPTHNNANGRYVEAFPNGSLSIKTI